MIAFRTCNWSLSFFKFPFLSAAGTAGRIIYIHLIDASGFSRGFPMDFPWVFSMIPPKNRHGRCPGHCGWPILFAVQSRGRALPSRGRQPRGRHGLELWRGGALVPRRSHFSRDHLNWKPWFAPAKGLFWMGLKYRIYNLIWAISFRFYMVFTCVYGIRGAFWCQSSGKPIQWIFKSPV